MKYKEEGARGLWLTSYEGVGGSNSRRR